MRLDDYDDNESGSVVAKTFVYASAVILLIFLVVLVANKDKIGEQAKKALENKETTEISEERRQEKLYVDSLISGETTTSNQLEFWDLYDLDESGEMIPAAAEIGESGIVTTKESVEESEESMESAEESEEADPATDGKHTRVVTKSGEEEWVEINKYLEKNNYDPSGFTLKNDLMKYYVNGEVSSFVGASVSKADGDVNFYQLKSNGVDYVMLRIGQRGYLKGEISLDENFETNLVGAINAEMPFGITFSSQAITVEEAKEEADFVIAQLAAFHEKYDFKLSYPVVCCIEPVANDTTRNESLDRNQMTSIVTTFMDTLKEAKMETMLCANKEWLLKKMYLSHLKDYDIWLDEVSDIPDYPYLYVMWHYSNTAKVNAGNAMNLSISFIDYSLR